MRTLLLLLLAATASLVVAKTCYTRGDSLSDALEYCGNSSSMHIILADHRMTSVGLFDFRHMELLHIYAPTSALIVGSGHVLDVKKLHFENLVFYSTAKDEPLFHITNRTEEVSFIRCTFISDNKYPILKLPCMRRMNINSNSFYSTTPSNSSACIQLCQLDGKNWGDDDDIVFVYNNCNCGLEIEQLQ